MFPDSKVERTAIQLESFLMFGKTKPDNLGSSKFGWNPRLFNKDHS